MQHLFLFVPLLTMNIVSREFNTGTVKLLYSSPVKLRQVVIGKFLALAIYNLFLLVAILGIFIVAACFDIESADLRRCYRRHSVFFSFSLCGVSDWFVYE